MRIAQIAPLDEAVPPKLYGGTERVVSFLTEELVALGHDVTLFASGDSETSAHLVATWPCALRLDPSVNDPMAPLLLEMNEVAAHSGEFDILHFHLGYWPFPLFSRLRTPFVTTLHGRLDIPEFRPLYDAFSDVPVVSISDAQRLPLPQAKYVRTVPHGLPERLLTPRACTPSYLAFLGRVCPEKGVDSALRIARSCGIPLRIAAKVDKADRDYYREAIEPLLAGGGVEMVGEVNDQQKPAFLSGASTLLLPIRWPEPFGLVMIEAMACGCPVIAFGCGSVPEIVEDGVTGFIVDDEAGAIDAVARLPELSRNAIRQRFEQRFTARRMAQDYLDVYRQVAADFASRAGPMADRAVLEPLPGAAPRGSPGKSPVGRSRAP
ncbi:MAG: glycosyltransferase family 4 protein [Alphaproteobacteria bacterium]|nr:glycosyltransferase family 4 protein [Alphaproteobacteria bacterium]